VGLRRGRAALLGAIVASAVMAFGVSSAQAATLNFSATFDDAALGLPVLGNSDILDPPNTATMTGTVDDTTGALSVPSGNFVFPSFSGTASGIPVTVSFAATQNITGTVDQATGAIHTNASTYQSNVGALGATCTYNLTQAFSTDPGSPFNGDPFTLDKTTVPGTESISNGVLQTSWPALPASGGPGACATIDSIVTSGPGGLALGNGFDLTPAAPPTTPPPTTPSPPATCAGKTATITGTNASETLAGTPAADVIAGLGGKDVIKGLARNDVICGGDGKDKLLGGNGNDKLLGGKGNDTLKGGPGKDKLKGGPGKDVQIQ
jgi:Ca2+-binding RTX toxin-like protein